MSVKHLLEKTAGTKMGDYIFQEARHITAEQNGYLREDDVEEFVSVLLLDRESSEMYVELYNYKEGWHVNVSPQGTVQGIDVTVLLMILELINR